MAGYIGKISAVVTANTSDLQRKMAGAADATTKFADTLNRSLNKSSQDAKASINKIFTPLQQLERKLKAAQLANIRFGPDKGVTDAQANSLRALTQTVEQLNRPLESATRQFGALGTEVQSKFFPALERAQSAVVGVNTAVQDTGRIAESSFRRAEGQINLVSQALKRLTEAQRLATPAFTGRELRFTSPNAFAALTSASQLTQQVGGLSAETVAGRGVIGKLNEVNRLSESVVQKLAKLESLRADPTVNTASIERAEKKLQNIVAAAQRAQAELREIIQDEARLGNPTGEFGPAAPFSRRDPSGRTIQERLAANVAARDREDARRLQEGQQELGRRIGAGFLNILTPAEAAADTIQARQQELGRRIGNGFLTIITPAEAAADTIQARQQELGRRIGNGFLTILTQAEAAADTVAGRVAAGRTSGANNLRDSFGGRTQVGINFGFEQQALQGYTAQLQILQQTIGRAAAEARGPAVASFSRLRDAISNAMERGELETAETRAEIQRLTADTARAAAQVSRVGLSGLNRQLRRAGDISRGSFGNSGLAVQQLAFAFDDFFSVTGGLDQRLRAAGNNISQFGFLIGGTAGLIAGISASIGSQLVVAFLKWSGAVEDTRSKTDALNSLLQEQKTITDSLAESYRSLGDSIRNAGLNDAGRTRQDRERQRRSIVQGEEDRRRALLASVDPEVQRLTEQRSRLRRRLEESPGAGERASLDAQLAELEPQIAAARARAAGVVGVGARAALEAQARLRSAAEARSQGRRGATVVLPNAGAQESERILSEDLRSVEAQRSALRRTIQELQSRIESVSGFFGDPELRKELDTQLQTLVAELALVEDQGLKEGFLAAVDNVFKLADGLDRVRQNLEGTGLENGEISQQVERINELQNSLLDSLREAREAGNLERVREIEGSVDALRQQTNSLELASAAVNKFAEALDRARQEAQSNLQSAQSAADQARRQDLGFSTPQTQGARAQAEADLARQRELATNVEAEAAAARERFSQDAARVAEDLAPGLRGQQARARRRQELAEPLALLGRVNELRQEDEQLRRRAFFINDLGGFRENADSLRLSGNEQAARELDEIIERLEELGLTDEDSAGFWGGVRTAIAEYEQGIISATADTQRALARVSEIDSLLGTSGVLAPGQRERLAAERAGLEQQAVELDERVRAARDASTREAEQAASAARGRDLSLTDGQRAAETLARGLEDIRQFFGRQAEETTGIIDIQAQREAQQRLIDETGRSVAPAVFALRDASENAVLSGPSRARLNASDITTQAGTDELNRLLRGDDSAREQNLVELRKQTKELEELNQRLADVGVAP